MLRAIAITLLAAAIAAAANVKLYMKDGGYHVVREYKVLQDRVRYYSIERSEWEEMPLDLVDLKRTESEAKQVEEQRRQDAVAIDAEEKAEREARREVERIPQDNGVYLVEGDKLKPIKQAESKVVNNKGRNVLKILSPVPIVSGKATVELDGEHSQNVVTGQRPEFYMRPNFIERFGIVKLKPQKNTRVVERLTIIPVSKEVVEEQDEVEIFRKQVDDGLYKIWPVKPLEPGEYAVIEYTEGKVNIQVWDFAYAPARR